MNEAEAAIEVQAEIIVKLRAEKRQLQSKIAELETALREQTTK